MSVDEQSLSPANPDPEILWQQANELVGRGALVEAIPLYLQVSDLWPERPAVWLNLGIVLGALQRHYEARQCLERALEMDPGQPQTHFQLGQMHEHLGRPDAAAESYLAATARDPNLLEAWQNLADICLQAGQLELAEQYLGTVLARDRNHGPGNFSLGNLRQAQGDDEAAARHFAIAYEATGDPACGNNLAAALERLGRGGEAIDILQAVVAARPDYKLAWNTLGGLFMGMEQFDRAKEALERAIYLDRDFHAARHGLARCLVQMRDLAGAREQFSQALLATPNDVSLIKDYLVVLEHLGEFEAALALRAEAMVKVPDDAELIANQANLLHSLRRFDEALELAAHALAIDPGELRAQITIASTYIVTERLDEARAQLMQIVESGTEDRLILSKVGALFEQIKEAEEAVRVYERIQDLYSDDSEAAIRIFDLKMAMCDWQDYDAVCRAQIEQLENGEGDIDVFNLQALPVDYAFIGKVAKRAADKIAADARGAIDPPVLIHPSPRKPGRIRLGYALAYTWFHSLPLVHKEIVARHDRDRFEVFGYSVRPSDGSNFCADYRGAFDHFRDLPDAAPYLAAQTIHGDGIDILIDVTGLTSINCMPVSSFRPAPIQMHGYGYSITTGADYIDYLITDRTYIPENWEEVGPEKLLYLPNTFMPTKRPEKIGGQVSRADVGLPENGIVFCNFNHPCKFEPVIFSAWMEIMKQVPGSVMWFGAWMRDTQTNLRREAAKFGIDGERLVFADIVEHENHLARLAVADLALDNLHHGGGITSVDALWVGLPVLTILGDKPGGRLGATLCRAAGVPQMIAEDLRVYVERAVELANDRLQRQKLREKLIAGRETHALFDNDRYVRNLDKALAAVWDNHLAGEPPRRLEITE